MRTAYAEDRTDVPRARAWGKERAIEPLEERIAALLVHDSIATNDESAACVPCLAQALEVDSRDIDIAVAVLVHLDGFMDRVACSRCGAGDSDRAVIGLDLETGV